MVTLTELLLLQMKYQKSEDNESNDNIILEYKELIQKLCVVDPNHSQRYEHLLCKLSYL